MEQERPKRIVRVEDEELPAPAPTTQASFLSVRFEAEAWSVGELRDHVNRQPVIGRTVIGEEEGMRSAAMGGQPDEPTCGQDCAGALVAKRGDEQVDVSWRATDFLLTAQNAPGDAR
jgi:hypothetical protein